MGPDQSLARRAMKLAHNLLLCLGWVWGEGSRVCEFMDAVLLLHVLQVMSAPTKKESGTVNQANPIALR